MDIHQISIRDSHDLDRFGSLNVTNFFLGKHVTQNRSCLSNLKQLLPVVYVLEIIGASEQQNIDWKNLDTFPRVQYMANVFFVQRCVFSIVILSGWLKVFEYLSVFSGILLRSLFELAI